MPTSDRPDADDGPGCGPVLVLLAVFWTLVGLLLAGACQIVPRVG